MTDAVRKTSAAVDAMGADWPMIDALMAGTPGMRAAGKRYLPQWPQETPEAYAARLASATLHPVFKRTVIVNAARPFSRPMKLGDAPSAQLLDWAENIDLQGSTLGAFAVGLMEACLSNGIAGVLVEYPKAPDVKTVADEKASGVRPYLVAYKAGQILGWKTIKTEKGLALAQLRLLELVEESDGTFGVKEIEQVRVLEPGTWAIWQKRLVDGKEEWVEIERGVTTLNFIPFVFFYGKRKGLGIGQSPLLDLAYQNVEHWQSSSDQQTILHVARVPILFARLFGANGTLAIGNGSVATSENEKATLEYVEHTGAAIEAGAKSIVELEDRMRSTGAELISQKTAYTTATEVSKEDEGAKSTLQQIVAVFEECLEQCLEYMAAWVKLDLKAEVELYSDFGIGLDSDPEMLRGAVEAGALSPQTYFEELQRRDVISADRDWQTEKPLIDAHLAERQRAAEASAKAKGQHAK